MTAATKSTTKTEDREKISIYLDHDQLKALRAQKEKTGRLVVDSIRKAIAEYLVRLKK